MFCHIFKYDENQPRDNAGRFSSTGFGAGKGPASVFAAKRNKVTKTADQIIASAFSGDKELEAEFRATLAAVDKAVADGKETYRAHVTNLDKLDAGTAKRAAYSRSRLKVHKAIIEQLLGDTSNFQPPEGTKPEVLLLGGRGGSGKGNFNKGKGHDSGLYDAKTHLVLDPDLVKRAMKEYDPEMAYLVHLESADIFDKLVTRARDEGVNMVLDTTMRSSVKNVVRSFEKHGYSLQAHFMHVAPEESAARALLRWRDGETKPDGTKAKRGRLVPPDVILKMTTNEANFDAILPKMDDYSVWANDRPLGVGPRRVDEGVTRKKVVKFHGLASVLSLVQKANPYHDGLGRFADHASATFVSISGVFAGKKPKVLALEDTAMVSISQFVDLTQPLKRIEALNKELESKYAEHSKWGLKPAKEYVPLPRTPNGLGGLSEKEIQAAFSAEKVSVYMAMSRATLKKVLGGEAIKNSLETGKGTFSIIGEERALKERSFLGVKAEVSSPENFPKYGFVSNKGAMDDHGIVGFGYGDVYVEFKDDVRKNTTVTMGDSYNGNSGHRYRIPAPIDAVGSTQFMGTDHTIENGPHQAITDGMSRYKKAKSADQSVHMLSRGTEYIEAQMYGKLEGSSIAAVHVESKKVADDLLKTMKKSGQSIPIIPAKTHTVLSRLNGGYLEDWNRVSPEDVKNLGDAYIEKGWTAEGSNLWSKGWSSQLPKFNVPLLKEAIKQYPKHQDVPVALKRDLLVEYITEARKGASGSLPKALHKKPSSRDGFTNDVLNKELLNAYI